MKSRRGLPRVGQWKRTFWGEGVGGIIPEKKKGEHETTGWKKEKGG